MTVLLLGCASLSFEVDGSTAIATGNLNGRSPDTVRQLLQDHPDLEVVVLQDMPGSVDDVAALEAARVLREAQLTTRVPSDGEIASGGVDFFLAGVVREVEDGGLVGVHSWSGGGQEGHELPRDHPEHELYLDYYAEMGITEDFYWFTLDAAEARDIHWMTREELETYELVTPD